MVRFKTEEEFIRDYGSDWKWKVPLSWGDHMDTLLGKTVSKEKLGEIRVSKSKQYEGIYCFALEQSSFLWISMAMLVGFKPVDLMRRLKKRKNGSKLSIRRKIRSKVREDKVS